MCTPEMARDDELLDFGGAFEDGVDIRGTCVIAGQ
jgi:hypothetical protein